jgi:hypothetical protein
MIQVLLHRFYTCVFLRALISFTRACCIRRYAFHISKKSTRYCIIAFPCSYLCLGNSISRYSGWEHKVTAKILLSPLWLYSPIQASAASIKLSVSLQILDLGQSVGLLGRVISSSQGSACTQTQKNEHTTQTLTSISWVGYEPTVPASPRKRWQFMP